MREMSVGFQSLPRAVSPQQVCVCVCVGPGSVLMQGEASPCLWLLDIRAKANVFKQFFVHLEFSANIANTRRSEEVVLVEHTWTLD